MDPLSMTASTVALLQITGTVTGYINDLRNASKEQQSVAMESGYLYGVLTSLRFRVASVQSKQDPWFSQMKALNKIDGPLDQMQKSLSLVNMSLRSQTTKIHQIKSAISWQWSKGEVRDLLQRMQRLRSLIDFALASDHFTLSQAVHSDVQDLAKKVSGLEVMTQKLEAHVDKDVLDRISRWLHLPDPSLNFQAAQSLRHGTTGSWLLSHPHLADWRSSESSILWLYGKAGCGKTVLSSTLIKALKDEDVFVPVAYFYFDFRDLSKQSPTSAIRSILFQIALQHGDLTNLDRLRSRHGEGNQQPSDTALWQLLKETVTAERPAYIVVDALDECTDRVSLLDILQNLYELPGFRFALTSRQERDIELRLGPITQCCINIESSLVDHDIAVYIQEQVKTDIRLKKWPQNIREEIISTVSNKAGGMFRWAHCQLEALRKCLQLRKLKETLASLPKTLDETYERILHNIEADEQLQEALLIMQWMCFSRRPLTLLEAADILTLQTKDTGNEFCSDNRLADPEDLLVLCSGFLESIHYELEDDNDFLPLVLKILREQENHKIVRLAHFSIKEYFVSDRCSLNNLFKPDRCNATIAKGCLQYLLHTCEKGPMTRMLFKQYPLAKYASDNWRRHVQSLDYCPEDILKLANLLLDNGNGLLSCARLGNENYWHTFKWHFGSSSLLPSLCYAANTGIYELVQSILQSTPQSYEAYGEALLSASEAGYLSIVQSLLNSGADVNFNRGIVLTGTALTIAISEGHEDLVKYLLKAGSDVQLLGEVILRWSLPVQRVEKLCYLLIDAGKDLVSNFIGSELPICIMRKILQKGIDIEAKNDEGKTALLNACCKGDSEKVQFLIDAGANVNVGQAVHKDYPEYDHRFKSALNVAASFDWPQVVEILIKAGAHVQGERGCRDLLHVAAETGNVRTINALLDGGADVNGIWGPYSTPLQVASVYGHGAVVKRLLEAGAMANTVGGVFGTALQAACSHAEATMNINMDTTLNYEVDVDRILVDSMSITWRDLESKVRLTLDFTATAVSEEDDDEYNVDENGEEGGKGGQQKQKEHRKRSRLGMIVLAQKEEDCVGAIIELVRPSGAQLTQYKVSPSEAGRSLAKDLDNILERTQRDQHSSYECDDYRSAIMYRLEDYEWIMPNRIKIRKAQTESITQALLDLGALTTPGMIQGLAAHGLALGDPRHELVHTLLDSGAEVNERGGIYGFALQAAARSGHLEACRLMIAHGADVNLVDGLYGTALQAASANFVECVPMVQQLLTADADVNIAAGEYGCALSAACYRGHINIVRILLGVGADVNLQGGTYGNPLQAACASSRVTYELVQMLIAAGADISAEGGKFGSALGACMSKRFRAAVLISKEQYEGMLEGRKEGLELEQSNRRLR